MTSRCRHLALIRSIQVQLNEMGAVTPRRARGKVTVGRGMGAVTKALPHLARPCDRVAKEVLAFISIMLFNANETVQVGETASTVRENVCASTQKNVKKSCFLDFGQKR